MKNELKLITDKTEYICTGAEQVITISNLEEEGVTDIFLTPDSISRYPIKSIDGEDITIDTLSLQNNSSKMFRLFGKVELPKLEILDLPREIQQNVSYPIRIVKGDWYDSSVRPISLMFQIAIGENEELYFWDSSGAITDSGEYYLFDLEIKNSQLPPGEYKINFKIGVFINNQTTRVLCETPSETFYVTPAERTDSFHESLYFDTSDFLFEVGQRYKLQIKSDVLLTDAIVRLAFNNPVAFDTTVIYEEVFDGNFIEFTMPKIDKLENGTIIRFSVMACKKNIDGSIPDFNEHIACSDFYNCFYYNLQ